MNRLIQHLATVDSTNERALAWAARGAPDGSVIIADEQTSGRGRRGRSWHSPEGGIYLSYVVRDAGDLARPSLLTLAAGVAAARAIAAATGLAVDLKWPNDVMTPGEPRKLAGILAEGSSTGSQLDFVVIGIGVNVSLASVPADLRGIATSLEHELGRAVDRQALADALTGALDDVVRRLRAGEHDAILDEWMALAPAARGSRISWRAPGEDRGGVTAGVADDGALLVQTSEGLQRLVAGEVIWS